ncbi:MAG: hypothetical protein WB493_03345, partial [Anaeromyxobacteraceae bacterium]
PEALTTRPSHRRPASGAAAPGARALHQLWTEAEGALVGALDGTSVEDLARRAQETADVHDFDI